MLPVLCKFQSASLDRENRQCLKCNSRSIGDEFQHIMEFRTQLISRNLTQRPNILKFKRKQQN